MERAISIAATLIVGVLSLVITRLLLKWVIERGWVGGPKMTREELQHYIEANADSRRYRGLKTLLGVEILVALGLFALVIGALSRAPWLRQLVQPQSIFFSPWPGSEIFLVVALFPILITCGLLVWSVNLFLPRKARVEYQIISNNTPIGDIRQGLKIMLGLWMLVSPFLVLAAHSYTAVTSDGFIANKFWSWSDRKVPFHEVSGLSTQCSVVPPKSSRPASTPWVRIKLEANTTQGQLAIWDDLLPPNGVITEAEIKQLYATMRQQQIPVTNVPSPECEAVLEAHGTPKHRALYDALVGPE